MQEFLRLYFRQLLRWLVFFKVKHQSRNRDFYFRADGKEDGIGAQLHTQLSLFALCDYLDVNFFYSPPSRIAHISDEEAKNILSNFDILTTPKETPKNLKWLSLSDINGMLKFLIDLNSTPVGIREQYFHFYTEKIRDIYKNLPSFPIKNNVAELKIIGIHVRRGDVDMNNKQRFESDNSVLEKIEMVVDREGLEKAKVFVFSQSPLGLQSKKPNIEIVDFNTNLEETFNKMCEVDVLIMAKSSLSFIAALMNPNTIYYSKFWHRPRPSWNVI